MSHNFLGELTGASGRAISSPMGRGGQEGREELSQPMDLTRTRGRTGALDLSSRPLNRAHASGKTFYAKGFLSSEALARHSKLKYDHSPAGADFRDACHKRSLYAERTQGERTSNSSFELPYTQSAHSLSHISTELFSKQSPVVESNSMWRYFYFDDISIAVIGAAPKDVLFNQGYYHTHRSLVEDRGIPHKATGVQ
jgi:hypothetical protein